MVATRSADASSRATDRVRSPEMTSFPSNVEKAVVVGSISGTETARPPRSMASWVWKNRWATASQLDAPELSNRTSTTQTPARVWCATAEPTVDRESWSTEGPSSRRGPDGARGAGPFTSTMDDAPSLVEVGSGARVGSGGGEFKV